VDFAGKMRNFKEFGEKNEIFGFFVGKIGIFNFSGEFLLSTFAFYFGQPKIFEI
jgi:hypothetical protein